MAIRSLQLKQRIARVCAASVSDVTRSQPRSLEEVKEMLKLIDAEVKKYGDDLKKTLKAFKTGNSTMSDKTVNKSAEKLSPIAQGVNRAMAHSDTLYEADYIEDMEEEDAAGAGIGAPSASSFSPAAASVEEAAPSKKRAIVLDDDVSLDAINKTRINNLGKPKPAGGTRKKKIEVDDEAIEFVKPKNMGEIKKQYDIVENLQVKKEQLDSVINTLTMNFRNDPASSHLIAEARNIRKDVDATINQALKFLNGIAIKTEPVDFKNSVDGIIEALTELFADSYDSSEQRVYVSTRNIVNPDTKREQTALVYTHYLRFNGFVDDEGFKHDAFFLVFTGMLLLPASGNAKPVIRKYITTLQKFIVPGRFKPGARFKTTAEGTKLALLELGNENFSTLIERTPIPASSKNEEALKRMLPKEWIQTVSIKDDVVTITFNPGEVTKANKDDALKEAFAAVAHIVRGKSKAGVKMRPFNKGKTYGAEFILVRPDKEDLRPSRVDVSTSRKILEFIENEVELDEEQKKAIIDILNS